MAVSIVLLAAVIAVVNGRPELTDEPGNEERVLEPIKSKTQCLLTLEVVYPLEEGEPPYPLCSSRCLAGEELWIDGVVFKRMSELESFGLMVEMTYRNGSLQGCKMVPYDSPENSTARQEAQKRCPESVSLSDLESQVEALVLSFTERIPDDPSSIPLHQRLEGFTLVGASYYRVSPNVMSWHNAVKYCNLLGASLALIESAVEQNHLNEVLSTNVWIDLNDIGTAGKFVTARGTPITYTNWNAGEPNNGRNEDCVVLHGGPDSGWNDLDCDDYVNALCEHPPVSEPQTRYTCPPGYWQHGPSCYILSRTADSYSRGEEFCSTNSAYPVFINSLGEQLFLAGKLSESAYIGYDDRNNEGLFLSSRFGIPLAKWWKRNEPNNHGSYEDCVSIEPRYDFYWNDVPCNFEFKIVCEKAAQIQNEPVIPAT